MHFSEMDNPIISARAHFALEVENWDEMLAHLEALGVAYSRAGQGTMSLAGQGTTSVGASATTPVSTIPISTTPMATA